MIVPRAWIVNSVLSTLIAVTCAVGDKKLQTTTKPLLKAVIDNSTHGVIGFFSAAIVFLDRHDGIYCLQLSIACMAMSSLIDADHFVAARSLRLAEATNLQSRPFLHNSTIPALLIGVLIYCIATSKDRTLTEWLIVAVIAFVTHHLRDADRRGLWFAPLGSTPAFPDFVYILLILATPYVIRNFVPGVVKYSRLTTTILEV